MKTRRTSSARARDAFVTEPREREAARDDGGDLCADRDDQRAVREPWGVGRRREYRHKARTRATSPSRTAHDNLGPADHGWSTLMERSSNETNQLPPEAPCPPAARRHHARSGRRRRAEH